ncbi:MAG: phage virion morphogenesis protein [Burkholderiales bacterium]|nr:phage virion morphogenesis protein [Burkholderiales bacterium]
MATDRTEIKIEVDAAQAQAALRRLLEAGEDLTPIMADIAGTMQREVEENFRAQGRPAWTPLAPSTLRRRRQSGADAKILQHTGQLAASITPSSGRDFAQVATNKIYGPIQHFGGTIRRAPRPSRSKRGGTTKGGEIRIPARPFMVLSEAGLEKIRLAPTRVLQSALDGAA